MTRIPVSVVQPLVEGWLAKFPSREDGLHALASASPYGADTWRKRLSSAWTPSKKRPPGGIGPVQCFPLGWWAHKTLPDSDVDEVLTAAGLQHLWQVELAKYVPRGEVKLTDEEHDHTCGDCGNWIDWENGALGVRIELKPRQKGKWSMWWSLCAGCAAKTLPILEPGNGQVAEPTGTYSRAAKLSADDIRELYALYIRDGHTLVTLGELTWEKYGYRSQIAASASYGRYFRRNGLPTLAVNEAKALNKKTGRRPKVQGKLTDRELRAAYELYWKKNLSFNQLGKMLYERYGYATHVTCASALCTGFKRLGLPARDRIEATVLASTKNGLSPRDDKLRRQRRIEAGLTTTMRKRRGPCTGTTRKGTRCRRKALADRAFCDMHDPNMTEAQRARLDAQKRAHTAKLQSLLVDARELVEALRAYQGSRRELSALTGLSYGALSRLISGEQTRVKPATLERGLRALTLPLAA